MAKAYTEAAKKVLGKHQVEKKPRISDVSWKHIEEREEINKKVLETRSERVKSKHRKMYADRSEEMYNSRQEEVGG